ncbi:LacI family transcriptional regulator [Capsulimonas corticalis]|uniref:LacI family transcriptional regulator n=1 Tax=Capsulimonas corticalis TaxID=2219043 RepID=A0A402D3M5_9BACT|nr:LacI family DNA-binding transcriptional regulator [Capsulimonas corticalis]BDI28589.1 LacI family transcriptional regulator [Capsulimonas corticalis]
MATIRDVATACGVSPSVVSYVINNNRPVAPKTRKKILLAMEEMDYFPSAIARGLSRKRMNLIGVIFSRIYSTPLTNPFFGPILDTIVATAMDREQCTAFLTWPTWEEIAANHAVFCDGRFDGLILLAPDLNSQIVPILQRRRMRFVVAAQTVPEEGVASIDIDNTAAAHSVVRHLLSLGHRRIAMLSGDLFSAGMDARVRGYRDALQNAGVAANENLIVAVSYQMQSLPQDVSRILALPAAERPTAIFFGNDELALAGIEQIRSLGLSVPDDISVVGFDDITAAATANPPLTTVRQPLGAFGTASIGTLLDHLDCAERAPANLDILPAELIVRQSTGPCRSR